MTALATARERELAEHELRRRVDSYLVRRGRPQTLGRLGFIFDAPRESVLHVLVQLECQGKVVHSRAGWQATQVPE
jgi:hypothetical protein